MTLTHTYPNVKEGGGGQMKSKQTSLDTYLSKRNSVQLTGNPKQGLEQVSGK